MWSTDVQQSSARSLCMPCGNLATVLSLTSKALRSSHCQCLRRYSLPLAARPYERQVTWGYWVPQDIPLPHHPATKPSPITGEINTLAAPDLTPFEVDDKAYV